MSRSFSPHFTLLLLLGLFFCFPAKADSTYRVITDLTRVVNDRVKVVLYPPDIREKQIDYVMPAVIPGSYSRKDFGRFVNEFTAYTSAGKKLKVKRKGSNVFTISKADRLERIEYWVDDTWDAPDDNFVFQPGGTNIQDKSNFVINHQGFYGYFEGYKMRTYHLEYLKPESLYAHTALPMERGKTYDRTQVSSYVKLVDNPIMFSYADTLSFQVANMRVHIGVYSDNRVVSSTLVRQAVEPLAHALERFFGTFPVDRYHFILYFPKYAKEGVTRYGGFGALEHSYSSFYFIPELPDSAYLIDLLQSIAGHEFLHILTPLNIHSEEIGNFDFRNPKMSRHLWMYEGVTEYFAHLIRLREKLIEEEVFLEEMSDKIVRAEKFGNVSFTDMSRNILDDRYKSMYNNVYQKGALIGLLLDIELLRLSDGKTGLRELMLQLAEKYGPDRPFRDEMLIAEITQMTYPEIGTFFRNYVEGSEALPLQEAFERLGWRYLPEKQETLLSFGELTFYGNTNTGQVKILAKNSALNNFGLQDGDILLEINGESVTAEDMSGVKGLEKPLSDQEVTLTIQRKKEKLQVKAAPHSKTVQRQHVVEKMPLLTPAQTELRKHLLGR